MLPTSTSSSPSPGGAEERPKSWTNRVSYGSSIQQRNERRRDVVHVVTRRRGREPRDRRALTTRPPARAERVTSPGRFWSWAVRRDRSRTRDGAASAARCTTSGAAERSARVSGEPVSEEAARAHLAICPEAHELSLPLCLSGLALGLGEELLHLGV